MIHLVGPTGPLMPRGFFQVVGQVGRSVAQSVEVTPKKSKDRGGWSQKFVHKVQLSWPVQ